MKKLCSAVAVILTLLAGCGAQPEPAPTSAPPPPTSTAAEAYAAPTPSHELEVTKDVEYVTLLQADAPAQVLDVYAPAETGPWPVVILNHYSYTNKDDFVYSQFAKDLAGRGLVVFVPQRRSLAATVAEAALEDGWRLREYHESWDCGVRFARENAAVYGGDPERVTIFGDGPAGLQPAFMGDDLESLWDQVASVRGAPPAQAECLAEGGSAHVDAFVANGGDFAAYEILKDSDPDLWALTSVHALIGKNPSLLVHLAFGEELGSEQFERTEAFYEALQSAGYDVELTRLPDTRGEIPWSGPDRETLIQVILEAAGR